MKRRQHVGKARYRRYRRRLERREGIRTDFWMKPIPLRQFDWSAVTDDYEPGHPIGYGKTEAEAISDLKEQLEETDDT